jgi:hypothetical protein
MFTRLPHAVLHTTALSEARRLTDALSNFDNLTPETTKSTLSELLTAIEPLGDNAKEFSQAVIASLQALSIPFSDAALESWASIVQRQPWLAAELSLVEAAVGNVARDPALAPQVSEYRACFSADDDGWPTRDILDAVKSRERALNEAAVTRWKLYSLYPKADQGNQSAKGSCLDTPSRTRWDNYAHQLTMFLSAYPDALFANLSHLGADTLREQFRHLRFGIFQGAQQVPDSFFEQHDAINADWQRRSSSFASFSAQDLAQALSRHNVFLSAIYYDDTLLQYGVTCVGRDAFLPQTVKKLERLNEIILPSQYDTNAWEYFSSGNPQLYHNLRHLGVDWYRLHHEMVSDLVLFLAKERILGIVELANPAARSHPRVGYEDLPTKAVFTSDRGAPAKIMNAPLLNRPYLGKRGKTYP